MPAPEPSLCTRSEDRSRGDKGDICEAPGQPGRERNSLAKAGASRDRSRRSRMEEAGGGGGRRRRLGWCPAEDAAPAQALAQLLEPRGQFAAPAAAWSHPGCPACRHAGGEGRRTTTPQHPQGHIFPPNPTPSRGCPCAEPPAHGGSMSLSRWVRSPPGTRGKQPGQNVYAALTPSPKRSRSLL